MKTGHASHGFPPLYNENSTILILGSFPSVASREVAFFYGHKQNRFWDVLAACFGSSRPQSIEEKKAFCLAHGIALYDSIESCTIKGSSDSSITDVEPSDLRPIFEAGKIRLLVFNGSASEKWFYRFQTPPSGIKAVKLPSTSPANAAFRLDDLIREWRAILTK